MRKISQITSSDYGVDVDVPAQTVDHHKHVPEVPSNHRHHKILKSITSSPYKNLIIVVLLIAVCSAAFALQDFVSSQLFVTKFMTSFMSGFMTVFGALKILNHSSFVTSFTSYNILAMRYPGYAKVYPFLEFGLGILVGIFANSLLLQSVIIAVFGVGVASTVRVMRSGTKIKCACMGNLLDVPVSTVTLIEDLSMIVMAIYMITS